jgi:hypothetical protein
MRNEAAQNTFAMRFSSENADDYNLYSYVHNNPITHIDCFGLIDVDVYIWSAFGFGGAFGCGGVGHVMVTDHGTHNVELSQFPIPHGISGPNTKEDFSTTIRFEGRWADRIYIIHLPNDSQFKSMVANHVARKTWIFYPVTSDQTQCAYSATSALHAGGLPIEGEQAIMPAGLEFQLDWLLMYQDLLNASGATMTKKQ